MQRIRIVSAVYPRPWLPESGRYAANLAEDWSTRGLAIDVVTSSTLSERLKTARRTREDVAIPGVSVDMVHTLGTPFGRLLPDALRNVLDIRDSGRMGAAMLKGQRPDLIYAQFAAAGRHARRASATLKVPYVVDLGESNSLLEGRDGVVAENRRVLSNALGAVCVSPRLRDEAITLGANPERVKLVPNYPNWARFRPLDKTECRQKLGLSSDDFIVVYVGHYIDRKGAPRLNAALHKMKHPAKAAFLGSGPLVPDFEGVIHKGSVQHEDLATWLNAADVLALPTLAEGCCNAIAEALACALPILTSDIPDLQWQVPDKGVILIDPKDVDAIAGALDELAANPQKVAQMRADLLAVADFERDKNRANEILSWMQAWISETDGSDGQAALRAGK
ncbi:glycosyltransferase [Salipiger marinus]|uniref:Glycosyltransferase involved in cell wall bisynthesis n=1 Tax=Salipiger marinus TaxID=555512 RepID=A0A1G8QMI0_9RHOB|nr:glycosyltransferase [Salipiger marinus]SDJ05300.1 Glycosyltransferase involved in cell wall bisynthesis [Salipiger marinus]